MKKIIVFLYVICAVNLTASAQADPQYTNYMFYKNGINPAAAGINNALQGFAINRFQWSGWEGAPQTLALSADAPFNLFGAPGGIGINIISEQLGFYTNNLFNVNYAYRKELSFGTLSFGISAGIYNQSIDGSEWEVPDNDKYTPPATDAGIPKGEASQVVLDAGAGIYLATESYYLGLSSTHLNEASIEYDETARSYLTRHYYLLGGYNIQLSDPLFEVRPSFLIKSDVATWQLDVNTNIVYNNKYWGGLSYRVQDAIALLMGLELFNGLRVGYSFDLVTSAIGYYGFASHEIFVSYSVNLERKRSQKYKSIRYL